jgi:1-deoxy-D-xylulose-5-phosphate reductoisomerase
LKRRISILGATGSVGASTLDLVEQAPERFEIAALTAFSNVDALATTAMRIGAKLAVIGDESLYGALKDRLDGSGCVAAAGEDALVEAALLDADLIIAAIVGCVGLRPVMAAVEAGRTIGLANKEALVTAGTLMTDAAQRSGATLLPVDSEHNAIFQCLTGERVENVRKLVLTASGGPFRTWPADRIAAATPEQAVAHPNWSMGAKISVDSATLMNKGLELIEAHHLFGVAPDKLEVVVHPQSTIHSLVEFIDGSLLAQLGPADMRVPLAHVLAWPGRMPTNIAPLDLAALGRLDFEEPDVQRFPALKLARDALTAGGAAPVVLNAANEVAVELFLAKRIGFKDISAMVERALERFSGQGATRIEEVMSLDSQVRDEVRSANGQPLP